MDYAIMHVFGNEEVTINLKKRVHFSVVEEIIDGIVDGVFDEDKYIPSRFEYFYWYLILDQYSDLDLDKFEVDELYAVIEEDREFLDKVESVVSAMQLDTIRNNACKLIRLKLEKHPLSDIAVRFSSLLKEVEVLIESAKNNPALLKEVAEQLPDEVKSKIISFAPSKEENK